MNIKSIIFFVSIIIISSCGGFLKKPTTPTKPTHTDKPTTGGGNGNNTSGNNNTGNNNNNNNTGNNNNNTGNNPNNNPTGNNNTDKPANNNFKSLYQVSLLLPFYTDKYSDTTALYSKVDFATDYYAGAKLALEALGNEGLKVKLNVLDSKGNRGDYASLLNKKEVKESDIIIGPAEKDYIPAAIKFSNEHNIPVVSPYYPSPVLDADCKTFVQVMPSLQSHCEAITKHIRNRYKSSQVVLVCRSKDGEPDRFKYFQDANANINGNRNERFQELQVNDENYALSSTPLETYLKAGQTTVFVVPSWNEKFISAFMRKLDAIKKKNDIVVYGMPQWMDFETIEYDFFERMNVRVSSPYFLDKTATATEDFNRLFYNRYSKAADKDAYLGYDTMLYLGKMLKKYGSNWLNYIDSENWNGLQSKMQFDPVKSNISGNDDSFTKRNKVENKGIYILKFEDYHFSAE